MSTTLKPLNKNKNNTKKKHQGKKRKIETNDGPSKKKITKKNVYKYLEETLTELLQNSEQYICGDALCQILETLNLDKDNPEKICSRNYFEAQKDLHAPFRKRLFDWIIQIHDKLNLRRETLFLSVNLFDRYLSKKQVKRENLQLLGSACLFIASKYHDVQCMSATMIVNLADGAFDYGDLMNMEEDLINILDFQITVPTSLSFLQFFLLLLRSHPKIKKIEYASFYFLESLLFNVDTLGIPPKEIASSAFYSALIVFNISWDPLYNTICGLTKEDIYSTYFYHVCKCIRSSSSCTIRNKYNNNKYGKIAQYIDSTKIKSKFNTKNK